jgi:carbamoyltransferase
MTFYLGLSIGDHNPAACLIENNKIIAIGEEERFLGFKYASGQLPIKSIEYCLKEAKIKLKDVDKVAVDWDPRIYLKKLAKRGFEKTIFNAFSYLGLKGKISDLERLLKFHFGADKKITPLEHHISHAYSSIPFSGFRNDCYSITVDGYGEVASTLIYHPKEGKIKEIYVPSSLGVFYTEVTRWIGFGMHEEGKTMGLASYGTKKYDFSKYISWKDGEFKLIPNFAKHLENDFGPMNRGGELTKKHENVAYTTQRYLEEVLIHLVDYYVGKNNLCLAGGVALNCVTNGRILRETGIKDIFVQPMAGDAGGAVGAAAYFAVQDGHKFEKMYHAYYSQGYENDGIEKVLKQAGLKYDYVKDPSGVAAELIADGKIVGWSQGRMEVGPRALGNRSILADPRKAEMKDIINKRVKHREPFRPFAPSLLEEHMDKYLVKAHTTPFMLLSFDVVIDKREEIPAVTHVDGTARPQSVTRKQNPLYYDLIRQFYKETGVPVVLNTSFNIQGKPINRTPKEAIATLYTEDMDALVLGNYLVKK